MFTEYLITFKVNSVFKLNKQLRGSTYNNRDFLLFYIINLEGRGV